MAKFSVRFKGYENDLVAQLGMACNNFVQRMTDNRPNRSFLREISTEAVRQHLIDQISRTIFLTPENRMSLESIKPNVEVKFKQEIEVFLEEHKSTIAELHLLLEDQNLDFGRTQ